MSWADVALAGASKLRPHILPVPGEALGAFHVSLGLSILAGGDRRFTSPSFAGARQLVGWAPVAPSTAWGLTFTIVGALVLYGWTWLALRHPRWSLVLIVAGAVPLMFLVLGFVVSLFASQVAATSGIGIYSALAAAHLHRGVWMVRRGVWDRPPHDRRGTMAP